MAGELGEQAIKVEWKAVEITAEALKALIRQLIENKDKIQHGQQSLSKLNLQGKKLEQIELTGEDMKNLRRELNRYSVDFSVMQDRTSGNHTVFFKGQDIDRVYAGLQKCVQDFNKGKRPIKAVMRDAEEKAAQRAASRQKAPEKEKSADRGHDER